MKKYQIAILAGIAFIVIFFRKIVVLVMIAGGALFFPEASKALRHYCFGDGSLLIVNSEYIRQSPVVRKHLSVMKIGQKKKIRFHQWEDWRLSFAINPFTMERRKDKVVITQWMQFSRTDRVKTWLFILPVPDNIVHTFDCTPYQFYSEFPYP